MRKKYIIVILLLVVFFNYGQQINSFSWKFYRPGNTGIQGDIATALFIDSDGSPIIAANTGNWGEGGFAKYITSQNRWQNFSNVDIPALGGFDNGDIQIFDIVKHQQNQFWMAKMNGAIFYNEDNSSNPIIEFNSDNSILSGTSTDLDISSDGKIWFANQQLVSLHPNTMTWNSWGLSLKYVTVQPLTNDEYYVWSADSYFGDVKRYSSSTNEVETFTPTQVGDIAGLPGKDCVDEEGNFWALRLAANGAFETLEYQTIDGQWIYPIHPYEKISFYIDAFKAFGNKQALLVTATGEVWRFDGENWLNYGTWRQGSFNTSIDIDQEGNVWVCGLEGAAKREVGTGVWKRYRLTNTAQIDYFVEDIALGENQTIWMTGNAGTGVGGIQAFDGNSWTGFNPYTYGLGHDFPFNADNATAITYRESNQTIVFSPTFSGIFSWNGENYGTIENELTTSKGLVEDSFGRLWSLGEYYSYRLYTNETQEWTTFPITGSCNKIMKDPNLPGTIWAKADYEIIRTDGNETFALNETTFPESNGFFGGLAVDNQNNIWTTTVLPEISGNTSLVKYNTLTGQFQSWTYGLNWPFPSEGLMPLTVSPDGLVWMLYDSEFPNEIAGLLAFNGTDVFTFPSAPGGYPAWNLLPNSSIKDIEVRTIENGYELWISCLGRGIAVLTVNSEVLSVQNPIQHSNSIVTVYPNPTSDKFFIQLQESTLLNGEYTIYDSLGRLITTLKTQNSINNQLEWNLTSDNGARVAKGLYFLKVKTTSKEETIKLIVN